MLVGLVVESPLKEMLFRCKLYGLHYDRVQGMFRFGPFDVRRVRYFGIDAASILRAPELCWRLAAHLEHSFGIGRSGIASDSFGLPSKRGLSQA